MAPRSIAHRDANRVPTLIGVSNVDFATPVEITVDPITGHLQSDATTTITGVSTAVNQTNASQKTQIVDGVGNVIGSTTNALDINIKSGNPTVITANAGTNLNTSNLALDATITKLNLTQGDSASGKTGPLMQGLVFSPGVTQNLTNGTIYPLGITNDGSLSIDLTTILGNQVSVAAAGIQRVGLTDGAGNAITSTLSAIDVNLKSGIANTNLAPAGTALNTYSVQLATNTTTTVTAATAYISAIAIVVNTSGTASTVTIQDKQATPLKLIDGLVTTAITTTPTNDNYQTPLKMVNGIAIVTSGTVAATINLWLNYYQ